jgi:hypothetical protein
MLILIREIVTRNGKGLNAGRDADQLQLLGALVTLPQLTQQKPDPCRTGRGILTCAACLRPK